ncbi:MAG: LuxR family transcriptional regulator [Acidobacteria bacterium]|nr:LuxR family transcriptional regulator [Acidobacteriota bacterium]
MRTSLDLLRTAEVPPTDVFPPQLSGTTSLSPREEQALRLITCGKCNKETATEIGITPRTVKFHVANLLTKFSVTSKLELFAVLLHTLR